MQYYQISIQDSFSTNHNYGFNGVLVVDPVTHKVSHVYEISDKSMEHEKMILSEAWASKYYHDTTVDNNYLYISIGGINISIMYKEKIWTRIYEYDNDQNVLYDSANSSINCIPITTRYIGDSPDVVTEYLTTLPPHYTTRTVSFSCSLYQEYDNLSFVLVFGESSSFVSQGSNCNIIGVFDTRDPDFTRNLINRPGSFLNFTDSTNFYGNLNIILLISQEQVCITFNSSGEVVKMKPDGTFAMRYITLKTLYDENDNVLHGVFPPNPAPIFLRSDAKLYYYYYDFSIKDKFTEKGEYTIHGRIVTGGTDSNSNNRHVCAIYIDGADMMDHANSDRCSFVTGYETESHLYLKYPNDPSSSIRIDFKRLADSTYETSLYKNENRIYFHNRDNYLEPNLITVNVSAAGSGASMCFAAGTQILCLTFEEPGGGGGGRERHRAVEDLVAGDLVKTRLHGFRRVAATGSREMLNCHLDDNGMHVLRAGDLGLGAQLSADLLMTGFHSVLLDPEDPAARACGGERVDDLQMVRASRHPEFERAPDGEKFTYYAFALENDGDSRRRYAVWANGLLVESSSQHDFEHYFR